MQCKVKLKIVNGHYILSGKHAHKKPKFKLCDIKKEIEASQPGKKFFVYIYAELDTIIQNYTELHINIQKYV